MGKHLRTLAWIAIFVALGCCVIPMMAGALITESEQRAEAVRSGVFYRND